MPSVNQSVALVVEEPNSFNVTTLQTDITPIARISTSSAKAGHPAENLRINRPEDVSKLWQSDSVGPHHITIELERQTLLSELRFFIDYKTDESYSPRQVVIQLGSSLDTLIDFTTVNCEGSNGWVCVDFGGSIEINNEIIEDFIRASIVRIVIISNSINGRDSRIRGVRLFSPITSVKDRLNYDKIITEKFIIKS